ncbi:MAG TPA: CHAT domain-containing protein [Thermoanaerobaculia bacterium]
MTFDPRSACSSSEVLGAFAEGRLGAEERKAVTAHLDTCERCRDEVALLADFVDSDAEPAQRRRPVWWAAAAAALLVIAAAAVVWRNLSLRDAGTVAPLIAASAALDHRLVEPRLHGFGWAEYRGAVRATADDRSPERLKILGAAGDALQQAEKDPAADAQHAAGVASLLIADPAAAIARLRAVAEQSQDPAAWSDLAAAHYDLAVRLGRASQYPQALAAADRALKASPRLPEALFNRALVLERLGMIEDARTAWQRYLEVDGASPWANEARRRMDALPANANPPSAFGKALDTLEPAELVARFPQQARATAEVELLGRWAEAFRGGNGSADGILTRVRAIGAALQKQSGESLLAQSVRAIDEASPEQRARIADAHLAYRTGRLALSRNELEAARRTLLSAASLAGGTPVALNARFHAAVAEYEAGRKSTAGDELQQLADELLPRPELRALRAYTAWQRGVLDASQARWPAALEQYRQAQALFAELGEASNGAFIDALLGEAAMMLGRRDEAWDGWTRALRALSLHGLHARLLVTLGMISRTESMGGRDETASSILDLEIAHANEDDRFRADALFRRAVISARMQDLPAARRAVDEGARIASRVADADIQANLRLAEGIAFAGDPRRALASLSGAIEHYRNARPLLLPVALRERGRALRALGRIDEATDDLRAAADAVERQRGELEWREVRATAVDGVEGIYVALVEALLDRGRTSEAFTAADRAAAHAFYGAAAARSLEPVETLQKNLGKDVVVEYLTLPRELLIFVVTARSVEVRRVAADDLPRRVAALNDAIRTRADVRAASLYPLLIAPVRDRIAGAGTITFIPDATLEAVPFSALYNRGSGRWLLEEHTIRRAPTALGAAGDAAPRDGPRIVVIQPPAADLPSAAAEAAAIARRYRESVVLDGQSPPDVLAAMETADIIHYAGHTDSSGETGLRLGNRSVLYGTDIARLRLRETPLVVLAGCRTLRGAAYREDAATSLTRAFLLAGAQAVVGTAWDLNDRAGAALFERMHAANAAAGDPVAALREAQLTALSNAASQPADWAAAEIIVRSAMNQRRRS